MPLVNIIVIYVKKNETQRSSSTIVQIAVTLLIMNVFLGNPQIASLEVFTHLTVTHTLSFSLRKLKTTLNVTIAGILAKSLSINVPSVISTSTLIVYRKDKCGF